MRSSSLTTSWKKGGVSEIYGPKTIMSGKVLDFKKIPLPFGSYCQVHEEKLPCNSLVNRTLGAISLRPSGNAQGRHKFFTLNTSRVITRWSWDVIPMSKSIVDRVNFIGRDQPSQFKPCFSTTPAIPLVMEMPTMKRIQRTQPPTSQVK